MSAIPMKAPTTRSLVAKLAEVMKAVERIPKRGRNDFHKYDYATEADIAATVRKELADRSVMLIPAIVGEARHPVGEKGSVLTVLEMEMEFLDGETGESLKKPWRGYGTDKEDKGGYKAMTGGEKYFLLKTFLMPTGDDPEREDKEPSATVKPDKTIKKARPTLPADSGAVYIEKVVPKSRGNMAWAELWISTGETIVVRAPQAIGLCMEIAQEGTPVVLTTHQNGRGNTELDQVQRWPVADAAENARLDAEIAAKEQVGF
jgi:hypothetical protein